MSLKGVKYGLYIATPVYGEEVNVSYMDSIVQLSKEFQKGGIASVRQHIMHTSLIVKARNDSLSNFMNETELDYFIFIDADISFNPLDVIKLMNHDKPLVAATYPKKHLNWAEIHNCFVTDMPDTSKELIEKTSEYTIYHKKKKKLEKKYPELMYKENGKKGYGFFETMIKRKEHLSEDYAFCERVKSVKEKVYIDASIEIIHHGGNIKFYGNYQNHLTYGNKK